MSRATLLGRYQCWIGLEWCNAQHHDLRNCAVIDCILVLLRHQLTIHNRSFMDNFEWADGYSVRFGLHYVDYNNNLARLAKDSAKWYSQLINS